MIAAVRSYSDRLAWRWVEKFVADWNARYDPDEVALRAAIMGNFPGRISNIVFSDSIMPGKLSFLYWEIDQTRAREFLR